MFGAMRVLPFMLLPLGLFALSAVLVGGGWTEEAAFSFNMLSGVRWAVSLGDLFLLASLIVLFVEIIKSVNTDARSVLNHGLSTLTTLLAIVLFVTSAAFTNSTFFLLIAMMLVDVIGGFVITIVSARRDFGAQS